MTARARSALRQAAVKRARSPAACRGRHHRARANPRRFALILQASSQYSRAREIVRPFIRKPRIRNVRQALHKRPPRTSFLATSNAVHGPVRCFFPASTRCARRTLNSQSCALIPMGGTCSDFGKSLAKYLISSPKSWLTGLDGTGVLLDRIIGARWRRSSRMIFGSVINSDHSRPHSPN
jgi:hypothetical protein